MAKGLFTQGAAILFDRVPTLDALTAAISPHEVVKRLDHGSEWAFGGPSLLTPFRPQVNGYVSIDIVSRPWPDDMGDPKDGTMVFGAWSMGHFGPYAYPHGLARASQQAWHWKDASKVVGRHTAFVRIRCSYVFGAGGDSPVLPEDYAPVPELLFVTELAQCVLCVPGALCYFNPNGECLHVHEDVRALLSRHKGAGPAAHELWCNVRMFELPADNSWLLMDTVGMWQLDAPDHEACFAADGYDPSDVAFFLRNAADYVCGRGPVVKDGDTMDGPGDVRWQGATFETGLADPPRQVLRWFPLDGHDRPAGIQGEG